ncbi:hypothetical protein [Fodinicola feengrottensis]|uniref:hypothetical protein n=1 Tax=Fodinicola feengrottensis TaxID=435914 RepID=UPI0013D2547A|nr:hypothetical protein [Fodinicola feengrottensis]
MSASPAHNEAADSAYASTAAAPPESTPSSPRRPRSGSPSGSLLDEIDAAFRLLVTGPSALSIDGRQVGLGLPARPIPLLELKAMLLHPSCSPQTRDAAWAVLVTRAQSGDPSWVLGAFGVAIPGLRKMGARLTHGHTGRTVDLDAELVASFLEHLKTIDPAATDLCGRLCWHAYKAAANLRRSESEHADRRAPHFPVRRPRECRGGIRTWCSPALSRRG